MKYFAQKLKVDKKKESKISSNAGKRILRMKLKADGTGK